MSTRPFTIEEVFESSEIARSQTRDRGHRRNSEWLQAHWADVLPHARGMFLAVADQESFIAKTATQAWAWVEATHPDDTGAFVHFIRSETGPRIYADSR